MTIAHKYDFVLLFDVQDGNPNGDPDAGNLPRVDTTTGQGLVTDVALKRKIRNYVGIKYEENPPYEIYVKDKAVLNSQHERAYQALGLEHKDKKLPKEAQKAQAVTQWMCQNFFDVRTFGAVMQTEVNAGQVLGPVQLTFARSVDAIFPIEHTITRMAVTNQKDADKSKSNRTMGRKQTLSYGLYRVHGFIAPHQAKRTGFDDSDLALLWESLQGMFELDRSASRGQMSTRRLYVFEHDSPLGNAPAHELFDRVHIERSGEHDFPQNFADYAISVDDRDLPQHVRLYDMSLSGGFHD
jgi:CRISPR-associated protein Csd2